MSYRLFVQRGGLVGLLLASLLVAAATPWAHAASGAATTFQTVTGSQGGYQFQVPSDWQQVPISFQAQVGSGSVNGSVSVDSLQHAPDQSAFAGVDTITGLPLTAALLPNAAKGGLYGGSASMQAHGGSALVLLGEPQTVTVANADAAADATGTYTDANGIARVATVRVALQGQTGYLLLVDVTEDFYQNDPTFAAMMNSFQLMPADRGNDSAA